MLNVPDELLRNPHFARYYRTWQKNEASIVFVPLAQICREQGLLEQAREICERGLEKHPTSVSGRLMLARIHFDQDQMSEARTLVERVLEEFPGQQEALSLLVRIRRMMKGSDENPALLVREAGGLGDARRDPPLDDEEITEVSAPSKDDLPSKAASPWENVTMAKIYADQGETRIARQMIDRILSRNPQDARALALKEELSR